MNSVVHFEIPVDDAERAVAFYRAAFDWNIQSMPQMAYHMVLSTPIDDATRMPKEPGAINGGMMDRNPIVKSPVITIAVDDMDAALARVAKAGGAQIGETINVGDMGVSAYFTDPEGNVLGLWQSLG